MPRVGYEQCLGGHAVLCVGYDLDKEVFIFRNSWGENWGDKGYFYLPFAYVLNANLAEDFWTIQRMS
jgi:C1A family cysteine protease